MACGNRSLIANGLPSEKLPLEMPTETHNYSVQADLIEIDGVGRHDLVVTFHSGGANSVDTRDKQCPNGFATNAARRFAD